MRIKTVKVYSQILEYQLRLARQCSHAGLFRFLRDVAKVDDWKAKLTDLKTMEESINKDLRTLGGHTLIAIDDKVSELQNLASKSLALLGETRVAVEVRTPFRGLRLTLIAYWQDVKQTQLLGKLPRAMRAGFNSSHVNSNPPKCLEGTRVDVLRQIQDWSESYGEDCILWLNGMAGAGKSTITRTIAHSLQENGRLGASFFFSRGKEDLGDATKLMTTLAIQLTEVLPDLKPLVCYAIDRHGDITSQTLPNQWRLLILQPLQKLSKALLLRTLLVIVIDALDECEGDQDVLTIIQLLAEIKKLTMVRIRVLISSRPERPIRLAFCAMLDSDHRNLMLQSTPAPIIEHDISIFLKHELFKIQQVKYLESDWPSEEEIQRLVLKADHLFIYAATALRFIGKSRSPQKRLSEMLQISSAGHPSTKELDNMYALILRRLLVDCCDDEEDEVLELFRQIVGSIIVLSDTLSTASHTKLHAVSIAETRQTLEPLHSVLDVPQDENSPIQLFHLSFRDFLVNKERCGDARFWIDEEKTHNYLCTSCLRLLSDQLETDMCGLGRPGACVIDVERKQVDKRFSPEVKYACRYWILHFQRSNLEICDNVPVLRFLEKHFLHWLEALSLIGKVSEGCEMIIELSSFLSTLPVHNSIDPAVTFNTDSKISRRPKTKI